MVLPDVVLVFRHAVDFDIGRADERHDVKPADLDPLQIGIVGLLELDGNIGFEPKHVGRAHLAFQVDQQAGIDPLEFDQPGRQPEGAEALR